MIGTSAYVFRDPQRWRGRWRGRVPGDAHGCLRAVLPVPVVHRSRR
jgi:hypothetical protein